MTGEVIRHSVDVENDKLPDTPDHDHELTFDHITAEEAKQIALSHAGVAEADARAVQTELDFDRGVEVYEVEFSVGRVEYEYEINAETGEVIKAERDYDD